jgi:uncharacterized membrane protein
MEPVMTTLMPFSKKYGKTGAFIFSFLSIVIYDIATGTTGSWTWITALTYGVIGILSGIYFSTRQASSTNFVIFSIVGTLLYDAVTGLGIGTLLWGQSLSEAFVGQIPFTLWHLGSNAFLAMTLSPLLYKWVVKNNKLETTILERFLAPSKI